MWYPGQGVSKEIVKLFISALNDTEVKAEISKQVRTQIDADRSRNGKITSYESLTATDVNMQAKMAASGYDVYGRTIMTGPPGTTNQNVYKKMKNQIKYGRSPQIGYENKGSHKIV